MIDVDTQNENSNDLPLEEDFAALLQEREESEAKIKEGAIVTGTVVKIEKTKLSWTSASSLKVRSRFVNLMVQMVQPPSRLATKWMYLSKCSKTAKAFVA